MDITKQHSNPNPRDGANIFEIIFFTHTIPTFRKGYSKTLDVDDLYSPLEKDRSALLGDRLEKKWKQHQIDCTKRKSKPSLLRVLVMTFWPEYLFLGILLAFMDLGLRLIQPLMLGKLLDYFKPATLTTKEEALWYAGAVVAVNAIGALMINQYIIGAFHYGMKVRAACCSVVYRKSLKLSRSALGETASGKVVNLLSNDVSRFDIVSIFIHHMWVAPLSAIIVTYFLWAEAGLAGIIGIVPVFLVVPLQSYTGKLSSIFRRQTAYKTDERVRLMDEIISGIQVIKMYAWEKPFAKLIKTARMKELKIITKLSYVRGLFMTFNLFTTRAALFVSLMTMVLLGVEITPSRVFVFMCYFNILSQTMSSMFVRGISEIAELLVSIKRLQEYLTQEEFVDQTRGDNNNDLTSNEKSENNKFAIRMDQVTTKWDVNSTENALDSIQLRLGNGILMGIIGPVGSGKSSMLQTILGELNVVGGNISVRGTLSYASQEAWVFGATIRQNITFGNEYHKKRYNEVVRVCALEKDFEQFENGDRTIVGDRGASLSGGQKARINLARAVYRNADIYLLDDPLSAVDVHVAKHIYEQCIEGYLRHKTRVLVTHQVHYLKSADKIIILKNGSLEREGTFNELANSDNVEYARLLSKEPEGTEEETLIDSVRNSRKMSLRSKSVSVSSCQSLESSVDLDQEEEVQNKDMQEESSKGKIKGSLFLKYLLAGGNCCFVFIVLFLYILTQVAASSVDYFVSYWTSVEEKRSIHISSLSTNATLSEQMRLFEDYEEQFSTYTYLYICGGLTGALFIIALFRSMLFYKLAMLSSQKLHDNMFDRIVATSMRFFDTNSSGRILNRFSKDIGSVDELLPKGVLDAGQIILLMFGSLLLVAVVNPLFLVPVAVISIVFFFLRLVFLKSSKNIKRLEGMLRSPVFTHLNATLQGLTTIRAYGAQNVLKQEFDKHQDLHTSAWYMYISASSAFGFYLDLLCFLFTALVTFSFLTFGEGAMSGGAVGLAITQASALTGLVQWGMRQSAEVANQLMSVERMLEYTLLPEEKQPLVAKNPPKEWPQHGKIMFRKLGMRYALEEPLVLKELTVTIQPKEKIGIVGRTGAGKSSLISALFRLAVIEGEIEIDSIDTENLELQFLRSKISIIPQDPVLFSGTLRYNLDPFDEYSDHELYKAIDEVELKDPNNLNNRLESRVMDKGSNYSVGQRQLICLARAIIRNNKILMLDEATANVDPQTDALIQKTIRRKFEDCTVLTVAHRLNTIMDSDKVLVMDAGTMAEFNHPYLLLKNPNSRFSKMVAQTGKATAEQLKKIAIQSYVAKNEVPEEVYL